MRLASQLAILVSALIVSSVAGFLAGEAKSGRTIVVEQESGGKRISGFGMEAPLPAGWRGRIVRGALVASTAPLPPVRGWLATELSRTLGRGDLGVLLFEYAPIAGHTFEPTGYTRGLPRPFAVREFDAPNAGRRRVVRRNFSVAGRFFDLFVEARERAPTAPALVRLNEFVRSLEIARGNHYPGTAAPARFPPASGWSTRTQGAVPVGATTASVTVTATVRYRDPFVALPPRRTIEALPPDGIAFRVTLIADSRHVPVADRRDRSLARPPYRLTDAFCAAFEGFPASKRSCVLRALVPHRYRVEIWVLYGRKIPTRDQLSRAQSQLDRLLLPTWPRWQ